MPHACLIALFARADHPAGYGFGDKAHGYSLILISYRSDRELSEVTAMLRNQGTKMPLSRDDGAHEPWYGGRFDLVAQMCGEVLNLGSDANQALPRRLTEWNGFTHASTDVSLGDNRHIGFYEATEILTQAYKLHR